MDDSKRPRPDDQSAPPPAPDAAPQGEEDRPDPTRYGDWEKNGIAVDF